MSQPQKLQPGPIALYVQLASIMRAQIKAGFWANGAEIPTIEELCIRYGVARVTVRQALQMLATEGLVSSQRGRRTAVTFDASRPDAAPLYTVMEPMLVMAADHVITVLDRSEVAELPEAGRFFGQPAGPYMRVRKIHSEGGAPYCVMEIHIERDLYRRLPSGADEREKLARLVKMHAAPALATGRERLTVAAADFEEAAALAYPMSAPVARLARVFCDEAERIIYFGQFSYRGDRFGSERDLSTYIKHVW